MANVTRSPVRTIGACVGSGNSNTGQFSQTFGGAQSICKSGMLSGNPGAVIAICSGVAGRLDTISLHNSPGNPWAQSGISIAFWDAGTVPLSGGPFPISGEIPLTFVNGARGNSGDPMPLAVGPVQVGAPFFSGLWARAASGAPGFSVTWTPAFTS